MSNAKAIEIALSWKNGLFYSSKRCKMPYKVNLDGQSTGIGLIQQNNNINTVLSIRIYGLNKLGQS